MGTQLPPRKGATQHPDPTFRPMSFVAKRSPISATAELLFSNNATNLHYLTSHSTPCNMDIYYTWFFCCCSALTSLHGLGLMFFFHEASNMKPQLSGRGRGYTLPQSFLVGFVKIWQVTLVVAGARVRTAASPRPAALPHQPATFLCCYRLSGGGVQVPLIESMYIGVASLRRSRQLCRLVGRVDTLRRLRQTITDMYVCGLPVCLWRFATVAVRQKVIVDIMTALHRAYVLLATRHMAHYQKTWRHPQNRKYITFYIVVRGGPSHGHGYGLYAQKISRRLDVWLLRCERTDRQTNRHAHRNTSHFCRGRS